MADLNWRNFEAVGFDFDGLMTDSEGGHIQARQLGYEEKARLSGDVRFAQIPANVHESAKLHGTTPASINAWILSHPEVEIIPEADPEHPTVQEVCELKHEFYMKITEKGLPAQPGVVDFIRRVMARRPGRLFIVTTARQEEVMPFLLSNKLNRYFPDERIISHETEGVENPKPAPDAYCVAIERATVSDPSKFLAFEDTTHGAAAGKAAEAKMINVATSRPFEDLAAVEGPLAPDAVVRDFDHAAQLIKL